MAALCGIKIGLVACTLLGLFTGSRVDASALGDATWKQSILTQTVAAARDTNEDNYKLRMYTAPRADSSADILWTSATDDLAVWTRLGADDTRREEDVLLDDNPGYTFASGLVALPGDVIAVLRNNPVEPTSGTGEPATGTGKTLTEFDCKGEVLRSMDVDAGEIIDGYWTQRAGELYFGFNQKNEGLQYTVWGESTGGGHYGAKMSGVNYKFFNRNDWHGGCSHCLAARGVHNHHTQAGGDWCLQDGFGGIYQWLGVNKNTYKFRYDYGYPTLALGNIVAYKEGYFVSMSAPRDNYYDQWGESTSVRTDVGVIFVPQTNSESAPPGMRWFTNTPSKTESRVHLARFGPEGADSLLMFWAETDDLGGEGGEVGDGDANWITMELRVVADTESGYHLEEVHKVENGGESATWTELMTMTSFPNGDVGWATSGVDGAVVFNRVVYPYAVDGGWTDWGLCECGTGQQQRSCSNPVASNGGQGCEGSGEQACVDSTDCIDFSTDTQATYPVGLDPATQDPSGGLFALYALAGGKATCVTPLTATTDCSALQNCCGNGLVCCESGDTATCTDTCGGTVLPVSTWSEKVDGNNVYGQASLRASTAGSILYLGEFNSLEACESDASAKYSAEFPITAVTWHTPGCCGDWGSSCYASLIDNWEPVMGNSDVQASKFDGRPCSLCDDEDSDSVTLSTCNPDDAPARPDVSGGDGTTPTYDMSGGPAVRALSAFALMGLAAVGSTVAHLA